MRPDHRTSSGAQKLPAAQRGAAGRTAPTWRQRTRSVERKTGKIGAQDALVALA